MRLLPRHAETVEPTVATIERHERREVAAKPHDSHHDTIAGCLSDSCENLRSSSTSEAALAEGPWHGTVLGLRSWLAHAKEKTKSRRVGGGEEMEGTPDTSGLSLGTFGLEPASSGVQKTEEGCAGGRWPVPARVCAIELGPVSLTGNGHIGC